jgi:hypothetical protein
MKIAREKLLGDAFDTVSKLKPTSSLATSTPIDVVIALPARDVESLTALLRHIYDPASPLFRRFLSPSEYSKRYDPTEASYQSLLDFVKANELTVVSTSAPKFVHVTASAAIMNQVFNVTLQQYAHPTEHRYFYAPDVDPEVSLEMPALQITGLDSFRVPLLARNLWKSRGNDAGSPRKAGGSGNNGMYTGGDFRAAYAPGVILTGTGQVVGVLQLDGYVESDIRAYEQHNNIPNVKLQNVYLNGYTGSNPNEESAADIELVISMAPGLSQVTIYGVNYSNAGIIDILHEMASPTKGEPLPSQITTSYFFLYDQNVYDALARLAAQGQALFVASGDFGSYNEKTGAGAFPPADHPLVTSVGGTELTTSTAGGPWTLETTASFSGGGYSPWSLDPQFTIPWWQAGMDYTVSKGSTTVRNAPDVSIVADGISVFFNDSWVGFSGTSAAAPLWAGFLALANEQAAISGRPRIGFANPALWAIGRSGNYSSSFNDITTGNNFNSTNPDLYSAVAGYDLCTGWGTPKGQSLINALVRSQQIEQQADSASWVAADAGGRLNLFVRGNDGAVWHIWQTAVNNGWSGWLSRGSPKAARLDGSPIVAKNADGRLQVFVSSVDGSLWSLVQSAPSSSTWAAWVSIGKPTGTTLTDSAVVTSNADGRLEVFAQAADDALWHVWQTTPNGTWSSWASQGNPSSGGIQGALCVGSSLDGRLELFAIGLDGALWHIWQIVVNGGWSTWFSHGKPTGQTFSGSTIPPVIAPQLDGRLDLFIPSLGGNMWRISQTVPNNGWSDWISHGQSGLFTNPPAIAINADGRLELYTPTNEGVCHIWQEKPNGDWADWFNQIPDSSSGPGLVGGSLALAPSADGRLELFMLGFDKAIWHIWQTQINGEWAAPISHGTPPNVQIQPNR